MKTNPVASRFSHRQSGMALISVLAVLFLLTLLVVAFMARTTGARASAANYRATASTKALADMAVNLVQAQINEATVQGLVADANGNSIGTETWGSQPGAIRVFASVSGTQGQLNKVYRLYSSTPADPASSRIIDVSSASNDSAANAAALTAMANDLPTDSKWPQNVAQWCDLNAYARDSEAKYHFPILDPRDPGAPDSTVDPATVATLWQPASSVPALHGISITAPGTVSTANNPAPMPVRWLYVLKDGSIVQPDSPTTPGNQLTFTSATTAVSARNPIVGRIAFWTDDESSKININTAAGDDVVESGAQGTNPYASTSIFWDTPSFSTPAEKFFAWNQPVNGEIQRYPGHPGAVGLNQTLSTLAGLTHPLSYNDFYSLTPRYTAGGSISATFAVPNNAATIPSVALTANRLYTSIGEMIYNVNRTPSALVASPITTTPTNAQKAQAASAVERANFFLTAHSSSSELNLSGTPRVSVWPVHYNANLLVQDPYRTPIDNLLAFDATFGPPGTQDLFYFQRLDSTSSVTDASPTQIPNNTNLFNYLDRLTSRTSIPGFGADFATNKYKNTTTPPGSRQLIAEIFDYIRTINVLDPVMVVQSTSGTNLTYGQNWGNHLGAVIQNAYGDGNTNTVASGEGGVQVVPTSNLNKWGCHGIGAFPIPVEITIDFAAMGTGALPAQAGGRGGGGFPGQPETPIPAGPYKYTYQGAATAHDQISDPSGYDNITDEPAPPTGLGGGGGKPSDSSTAIQAFIYVSFVNPGQITSMIEPAFAYSMSGLNYLSVCGYVNKVAGDPTQGGVAQGDKKVYLHFPGATANIGYSTGVPNQTLCLVVDNPGGGFIGGDVGDWVFGYVSIVGQVGQGTGDSGLASMTLGKTQNQWSASGTTYNTRTYPFYSQIFGVPGVRASRGTGPGWTAAQGNPSSLNNAVGVYDTTTFPPKTQSVGAEESQFQFNGNDANTDVVLNMYDANQYNDTLLNKDVVSSYQFAFPAAVLLTPVLSSNDSQIIGTGPAGSMIPAVINSTVDRWHQSIGYNTNANQIATSIIALNDTVQSLVLSPTWSDVRDLALSQVGSNSLTPPVFGPHPLYGQAVFLSNTDVAAHAHDLYIDCMHPINGNFDAANWGRLVTQTVYSASSSYAPSGSGSLSQVVDSFNHTAKQAPLSGNPGALNAPSNYPTVPPRLNGPNGDGKTVGGGAYTTTGAPGDWDTGVAAHYDGPWVNMPDEGALMNVNNGNNGAAGTATNQTTAYYSTGNNHSKPGTSFAFSPNREMPSPGMFGSLPTGVDATNPRPWQTLLFRPGAGAGGFGAFHPGEKNQPAAGDPADHMILDLFWMPQAEPYPISTPFATEGKINLNYEIQPFTYITRDTALRALFASEMIAIMPDSLAAWYKEPWAPNTPDILNYTSRLPIDPDATLGLNPSTTADPHAPASGSGQSGSNAWYDSSANTTRFFKSASELCEMFLVPQGYSWKEFSGSPLSSRSWYKIPGGDFALVGDNKRERPYTDLYSRVTTKSNTFTVYYTVQSLKNAEPQTDAGQQKWDENLGGIVGEYRGSTTLERYLDPNQTLPDYLNTANAPLVSLEPYYRWRVVATRQFAP